MPMLRNIALLCLVLDYCAACGGSSEHPPTDTAADITVDKVNDASPADSLVNDALPADAQTDATQILVTDHCGTLAGGENNYIPCCPNGSPKPVHDCCWCPGNLACGVRPQTGNHAVCIEVQ